MLSSRVAPFPENPIHVKHGTYAVNARWKHNWEVTSVNRKRVLPSVLKCVRPLRRTRSASKSSQATRVVCCKRSHARAYLCALLLRSASRDARIIHIFLKHSVPVVGGVPVLSIVYGERTRRKRMIVMTNHFNGLVMTYHGLVEDTGGPRLET